MKRLIYFTYLGLLLLILISCQKENIAPSTLANTDSVARTSGCKAYSYSTKTGIVNLGNVRSDNILVVFTPTTSAKQRLSILNSYQIFKQLEPEFYTDSGDTLQILKLKPNANCQLVEAMLASLKTRIQVKYATPVFDAPANSGLLWIGQTNEFFVTLTDIKYYSRLQQLATLTNTSFVDDYGGGVYLMATNKNSTGDVLAVSSRFNQEAFVSIAEPNFLGKGPTNKLKKLNEMNLLAQAND